MPGLYDGLGLYADQATGEQLEKIWCAHQVIFLCSLFIVVKRQEVSD
jgi:hypothetical protein